MKNYIKVACLILTLSIVSCIAGCGNNSNESETDSSGNNGNANTGVSTSEDYFEWDGNIIIALTDSGAKQNSLVIPERCEGFNGMIFADKENNVTSVSFESDKDVDLNGVFGNAEKLTSILLPANLTKVSDLEFWLCSSLKEITLPAHITSVGAYAFQNATSLTTVNFEGNVTDIMKHAFDGCTGLKTVVFPDTITFIDEYAFYQCTSLENVTLPTKLSEVGDFAFANSGLKTLTVPNEMKLSSYTTTSFTQVDHEVSVNVFEGSWADQNFETVFVGAFVKNISK